MNENSVGAEARYDYEEPNPLEEISTFGLIVIGLVILVILAYEFVSSSIKKIIKLK